jgi:hypothetical protein
MNLQDRIDSYVRETKFPRSLFLSEDGRIVGTWIMGNDYRMQTGYYDGYPAGYLRRVRIERDAAGRISRLACCKTPKTAVFLDDLTSDLFKHKRRR